MAKPSNGDWDELARDLSARVAAHSPEWTNPASGDPGITILELFEFLLESHPWRADLLPAARSRLREVLTQLDRADDPACADGTLTRNRYFFGKVLSVDDFEQEQAYNRTKHRRHNRLLHGYGTVHGLGVTVVSGSGGGSQLRVAPGIAIGPDGEELVICDPVTLDGCAGKGLCYVTLALVERPVDPTSEGVNTRIEESAQVSVSEDVPPGHLAIARLRRENGNLREDPGFRPTRVR